MKTIYLNNSGNTKIVLDNDLLDKVKRAKDRVYDLSLEEDWAPSLEIELAEGSSIKISASYFERMGQQQQVISLLAGVIPSSLVSAIVGHYGYEGWETSLHRDVLDIPDLYFDHMFIVYLRDSSKEWKCIDPEHIKTALAYLYRSVHQEIKYGYRNKTKMNKLAALIKKVYRGQSSLDTLMRSINRSKYRI